MILTLVLNLKLMPEPKEIMFCVVRKKKKEEPRCTKHPENDNPPPYKPKKVLPGNSTYASVSKHGKKILILSDSLCSSIRMKEFNHHVKNGYAYRKTFPGATVQDLAHYCLLTLRVDQPDVCVINIGCNNLDRDHDTKVSSIS